MRSVLLASLSAVVLFVSSLPSVFAATINVPKDQKTIQAAIDTANPGDTVLVAPGHYKENIDFRGKAIILRSSAGPAKTTIDGQNLGPVITMQTRETVASQIVGFTIRNGSGVWAGGVYLSGASPTIVGNNFVANTEGVGGFGAAIGGNGSSPYIAQNVFSKNSCDIQFLSGVVSFVNSSAPIVVNNVFHDNPCRAINMTLPSDGLPVVLNNTIVRNPVGIYVDAGIPTSQQIYENNLLYANQVGLEVVSGSSANYPTWKNNLVYGGTPYSGIPDQSGANGNISGPPKILSYADFHEQYGSPAINAGDNNAPDLPTTDFDGNPRVQQSQVDIGAYEFLPTTLNKSTTSLTFGNELVGTTSAPQTVTVANTGTATLFIELIVSGDFAKTSTCAAQLAPGSSCTIEVTFDPKQTGAQSGRLTLSDNVKGSQQIISLSGTGT
jgi:serine protease